MIFRRSILVAVLGSAALSASTPLRALTPYRVADINPTFQSASSRPDRFVRVGARALFIANTPGLGLWSSDGTAAGTVRLARNQVSIDYLAATGDLLFFFSCDPQRCRLLATDGTIAGTRAVASPLAFSAASVVAGPRRIFFVRETAALGHELWTSDGTAAGTRLVKDLMPGPASSLPENLVWFRDRLWFFALNGLWTSDGRASGTRRIAEVGRAAQVGAAGSRLLFSVRGTGGAGARLWSSDGTAAGTRVLPGVSPRTGPGEPPFFASTGSDVYFFADRQSGADFLSDLWASDGTPGKTRKLKTFDANGIQSFFRVAGTRVAFAATDEAHGFDLWVSDGRAGGTRSLDLCPGDCDGLRSFSNTNAVSDGLRIWFAGDRGDSGEELWVSDLTPAGTRMVKDIQPGSSAPRSFQASGGKAFFLAGQGGETQIWTSDGTAAGTRSLTPLDDETSLDIDTGTIIGEHAIFRFNDVAHGSEPWVTNGTPVGTTLLADLEKSQDGGSFPSSLGTGAGRCFFIANKGSSGREIELWSSNGIETGTALVRRFSDFEFGFGAFVADLGARAALIESPFEQLWISDGTAHGTLRVTSEDLRVSRRVRVLGGRLLFEAYDDAHGGEVWVTDGTPEGTVRLSDFESSQPFSNYSSDPQLFHLLGNRLAFLAKDSFGRLEPWVSDGTIGGTRRLAEVYPALVPSFFELSSDIVEADGKYYYVSGEDSEVGTEPTLWVSDLTAVGTKKIGPLRDSAGVPADETGLFALGDKVLLFYRTSTENGFWSSDGTSLVLGAKGAGGTFGSNGLEPKVWNGRLVYRGEDGKLYATDGTAAGTERLRKRDGTDVIDSVAFAVLAGRLAYSTFEGIWETDGTPQGTVRRVAPRGNNRVTEFVQAGGRIFFPGYDAATGTELWALRP